MIEELSRAGEVLCRYEVEKKQAIEREDYDTAKLNKVLGYIFCKFSIKETDLDFK